MNVPTVSLGLTMGWVSLASGERELEGGDVDADMTQVILAAGTTFLSALAAVPLAERALSFGRKFTVIATSLVFAVSEQPRSAQFEPVRRLGADHRVFAGMLGVKVGRRRVVGGTCTSAGWRGRHGGVGHHAGTRARNVRSAYSRRCGVLACARA